MVEIIQVNSNNIDNEHICCSIVEKKGENCVKSKKSWLKERFGDGLIFKKANVRGKVFIEYIPGEKSWHPINANDYMIINCFWVSGKFKGQGISNLLLDECIKDSKELGKKGIAVVSSNKKMPYISDGKHLKYKGFKVCDTANPYYELLYLPFEENAKAPTFKDCAKLGKIEEKGLVVHYSNQCPFTDKYVQVIKDIASSINIDINLIKYEDAESAKNSPSPSSTYSIFYKGEFVTNDILSEKKFIEFLDYNNL